MTTIYELKDNIDIKTIDKNGLKSDNYRYLGYLVLPKSINLALLETRFANVKRYLAKQRIARLKERIAALESEVKGK